MNFSKRQNEFCDIPGFDASRGERVVKALQKLWKKIQYLEQSRILEKKSRSEVSCSLNDEDLTLTDVQYKLLVLQLQYVRSLLRQKIGPSSEVFHFKTRGNESEYNLPRFDRNNSRQDKMHPDMVNKSVSTDIVTSSNSVENLNLAKELHSLEDKSKNTQATFNSKFPRFQHSTEESTASFQKSISSSSKPHYHLRLDDVPFILGASSTDSHSVVANVQNIIAMMKSHNKALCGSKPNVTRSTVADAHSTDFTAGENSQDVTKLINELSRELSELSARQQKLVQSIDAKEKKRHDPENNLARNTENQKHGEIDGSKKYRSNSESDVKLHAEVKKTTKLREKDFAKAGVPLKQSACNVRSHPNPSIMDRRKLLRSLQNFKKHLSEEDISWN